MTPLGKCPITDGRGERHFRVQDWEESLEEVDCQSSERVLFSIPLFSPPWLTPYAVGVRRRYDCPVSPGSGVSWFSPRLCS